MHTCANLNACPTQELLKDASILLMDDDADLREVLRDWFSNFCGEVHTASNGSAGLAIIRQHPVDVVLTDLQMPFLDGLQVLSMLTDVSPDIVVVFLTGSATMDDAICALRGGRAFDFLLKPVRDFKALRLVMERAYVQSRTLAKLRAEAPTVGDYKIDALTPREREVMTLLATGHENRVISERLCLSEKTVKNHLTRIYEKLNVTSRTQALIKYQRAGLLWLSP